MNEILQFLAKVSASITITGLLLTGILYGDPLLILLGFILAVLIVAAWTVAFDDRSRVREEALED